ncbi:phosphoadenosine phosphosulfate reductase [Aliishimia ponticola]|uniref:Phosphoadenosine phosphosulfate reductase n=1 Tax=Aliishimia ponticola TaxID=2499833 RepID=A0A4S4NRN6_9RHOB|nr:phosphoadenosine phosphosulfate reductase [Aliishimia ponticola]THH38880.1 phosphoadenosine phosphosulfate reductase [Aliishimia ponticola]
MQDVTNMFDAPLAGLNTAEWLDQLEQITQTHGAFQRLGTQHFSALIEDGTTLLVTFETIQGIRALDEDAQPLGWEMVKGADWSHLALVSNGDTWFRAPEVFAYFDSLIDDGFFDEYDRVVFYGAGPCGYAAAAFSVAAPGSTVVAIQPQATLDPEIAEWDDRFTEHRRRDFTSRYGYAPDMLDAAKEAFILYDPKVELDAMHAALFSRPNVTKLRMRHMGAIVQTHLMEMQLLYPILAQAGVGRLTRASFGRLMRKRRDYPPYLRNLLTRLDRDGRDGLSERLCRNVTQRMRAPKFARRLKELEEAKG